MIIPSYWRKIETTVILPNYIKFPDTFLQSKINNYNNIFKNCFGLTKIQTSDIDGIYHLGYRGNCKNDYSKDKFIIIESKIGYDNFTGGQEILAKSITHDERFSYLILFFDKEDIAQQNPTHASLIENSKYTVENKTTDKYKLNNWMKKISKQQNIIRR